jgi:hypothetical protein
MTSRERNNGAVRRRGGGARLVALAFVAAVFALTSACARVGVGSYRAGVAPEFPPYGFIYTHFRAPLVLPPHDAEITKLANNKSRDVIYVKVPVASADFSGGRADIQDAARRAGLKRFLYADYEYTSVLGYIQTLNVRAYGYKD